MKIDSRKWTSEHIESNIGKLSAQIVINQLIDNGWHMWFVGNTDGNSLYTVDLSSGEKVIVGFTTEGIGSAYINKGHIAEALSQNFGNKLVLVQFPLLKITQIMQHNMQVVNKIGPNLLSQQLQPSPITTMIINPTGVDTFLPLNGPLLAEKLLNEGYIQPEMDMGDQPNHQVYEFHADEKRYWPSIDEESDVEIP
tara:strand:- start:949 stop:1536 length:588 start_codon:yes stop_codon:yes gene_type:complete